MSNTKLAYVLALCLSTFGGTLAWSAPIEPDCSTPRASIQTLLDWLQPAHYDTAKAATCIEKRNDDATIAELRARQILDILDAKGAFVQLDDLPSDPNYANSEGEASVVMSRKVSDVTVDKRGDQWLVTLDTQASVAVLHENLLVIDLRRYARSLPAWMQSRGLGVAAWQIFGLVALTLIGLIIRTVVSWFFAGQAQRVMERLKVVWGQELLAKVGNPLGAVIAVFVVGSLLPTLVLPVRLNEFLHLVLDVIGTIYTVVVLYRVVDLLSSWLTQKANRTETKLDDQLVPLISRALKILVLVLGGVFILESLNYDVASLLAGLGIGGLAFALAAKDTIANLFGSVTIFTSKPFHIGDWVVVAGVEGTVETVGFRSTRIRTFYNSLVSLPNSVVADSSIDNYGERRYRRLKMMLGVTYSTTSDQIEAFVEGIKGLLQAHPAVRQDYYEVHFNTFSASSLDILLYVFFDVASWTEELTARHRLLIDIKRLAEALEIDFAFPTQTVHLDQGGASESSSLADSQAQLSEIAYDFGPKGSKARPDGLWAVKG